MQLQSKLTMAVVTERTKNSSSASSSATTKMPSGALTLNTGLLGCNLYDIQLELTVFCLNSQYL